MKIIRNAVISVLVVALIAFTAVFVMNAYNTGKIGDKAGKLEDTFTQNIIGTWVGEHSISSISFNEDGTTSLTMLGIVLNGEYDDSYDLNTEVHTLKVKYSTALGISVERYFTAELKDDQLSLIDTQLNTVKMIYNRKNISENNSDSDKNNDNNKEEHYNPGMDIFKRDILGEWLSEDIPNSGYEFNEDSSVYLKIYGVGYDGTYSLSIDPVTERCVLKINYISVAGVTVSNTYYVSIVDNQLTLSQKSMENITAKYIKNK